MSSLVPAKTVKTLSLPKLPPVPLRRESHGLNLEAVLASRSPKVGKTVRVIPPLPMDTGKRPPLHPMPAIGHIVSETRKHGIVATSPRRKTARLGGRKTRRRRRGGALKFLQKKPLSQHPGPSASTGPHEIAHIRSKKSKFVTALPPTHVHVHHPTHGEAKHRV